MNSTILLRPRALLVLAPTDALVGAGFKDITLACSGQGVELTAHWRGQKLAARIVPAANAGAIQIDLHGCKLDGVGVSGDWVERHVAPHVPLPYHDNAFWLALPWAVARVTCSEAGVKVELGL